MQAPFFRTFATSCRRLGSNFARLGLGTIVVTDGTVRLLIVRALSTALRLFRDVAAANVCDDVLSSSLETYNFAGERGSSVAAIVTIQRTTALCRRMFLGPAMSHF